MEFTSPSWFRILLYWQRCGNLAMTFPFLIGALRSPVGSVVNDAMFCRKELARLLESIRDETPEGNRIRIYKCPKLREPVISPSSIESRTDKAFVSPVHGCRRLFLEPMCLPTVQERIEEVADALWRLNGAAIVTGRLSHRAGLFEVFDDTDRQLVVDALAYDVDGEI